MPCARPLARDSAGNKIAARMAMMAITTSNSSKVKPLPLAPEAGVKVLKTGRFFIAPIRRIELRISNQLNYTYFLSLSRPKKANQA